MPAADRRTPAELLAETDELARRLLLEVTAVQGPAMLRAFPTVVEAAARVWSTLPRTSDSGFAGVDPMFRLVAVALGIDRAKTAGLWPGDGPTDERLLIMAETFTRAANVSTNPMPVGRPDQGSGGSADLVGGRAQVMHVLYVTAHAVTVGLVEHAGLVTDQLRRDSLRKLPSSTRYDPGSRTRPWP